MSTRFGAAIVTATLILLSSASAAARPEGLRCTTVERMLASPRVTVAREPLRFPQPGPPPQDKQVRDAFGAWAAQVETANFVVKWGGDRRWSEEASVRLAGHFEEAWAHEIVESGYPLPTGADTYKVNVYVTEAGDPYFDNGGGFTYIDEEGFPFIALSAEAFDFDTDFSADYLRGAAAHEFFHTIQFATGAYESLEAFWYWEATATWMMSEVYPDSLAALYLPSTFVQAPHLALEIVETDGGDSEAGDLHRYGAGLFARYLTEEHEGRELIRASWLETDADDSPLDEIGARLAGSGATLDVAVADFAAHNVFFDYPSSEVYLAWSEQIAEDAPSDDHRVAATVPATGTVGLEAAPTASLPHPMGYNVIAMTAPPAGDLRITVEGDESGSQGTPSRFEVRAVRHVDGQLRYDTIESTGSRSEGVLVGLDGTADLHLVVAAVPDERRVAETFAYRFAIEPLTPGGGEGGGSEAGGGEGGDSGGAGSGAEDASVGTGGVGGVELSSTASGEEAEPSREGDDGCGCRSAPTSSRAPHLAVAAALGLAAWARRRIRHRPSSDPSA